MDKVSVRISCSGEWSYTGFVELSRADFDRLDAALDSDDRKVRRKAEKEIGDLVDMRDIDIEDGDTEVDDFSEELKK